MSYSGKFKDKNNNLHPVTSVLYGTCDTAAATAAKVVTCTDFDTLMTGVTIRVKFANANTAASPTVNINSTGAKSVYRFGSTAPVDGNSWNAGEVVELVYDGTSFFMTGADDIAAKQNATDNSLDTEAKTIVGAINEHEGDIDSLKSGLTNLSDHVDGDATTYPYADVITIEDAVPANLADCSVKVEPVQDLHGYDKPWVGGASKNSFVSAIAKTETLNGITISTNGDGIYAIKGTASTQTNIDFPLKQGFVIPSSEAHNFFLKNTFDSNNVSLFFYNDSTQIDTWNCTPADRTAETWSSMTGNTINRLQIRVQEGTIIDGTVSPMFLLKSETDTSYAPWDNICPISGHTEAVVTRCGKNLFNGSVTNGYYINASGEYVQDDASAYSDLIRVPSNVNVVFSGICTEGNAGTKRVHAYDKDGNWISVIGSVKPMSDNTPFSCGGITPQNCEYVRLSYYGSTSSIWANVVDKNIQLEVGSTATPYEPYAGQQYTLALGDTIYGGTVDFDSGVMTASYVSKTFDENVVLTVGTSQSSGLRYADIVYSQNDMGAKRVSDNYMICSSYAKIDSSDTPTYGAFRVYSDSVAFLDEDFVDVASAKAKLNGVQLVYELATPTTIQLTPQQIQLLQGQNTLTASTGDISVTVNGVSGAIGQVQEQVNDHEERIEALESGGGTVKELRYTGTGTTPNTIDFGNDTPKRIMCIIPDPDEEFLLSNYEAIGEISWGMMIALSYWSTQSGGVPTTSNGGTNLIRMSFSGNTVTLNAGNAAQIANYSGQKYLLKYEV